MFIYPLLVALICLIFLDKFFGGRQCVYAWDHRFHLRDGDDQPA